LSYPQFVEFSFAQLYQAEYGKVFRVTWAFCGDRGIAEDATQEAFVRALERWSRLREQPWVAGWIISTALNVARRLQRRSLSRVQRTGHTPAAEYATGLWLAERRAGVRVGSDERRVGGQG
jgi:DNA-directed RNA polymerase specialized sigma24 family protein